MVLKIKPSQQIDYNTDELKGADNWTPYSRLAEPLDLRNTSQSNLVFRTAIPDFAQSPFEVTARGGIVYLKGWAPQTFPCTDTCPTLFIVEWFNSVEDRVILGSKVFQVSIEKKKTSLSKCKGHGKSESHWDLCAKYSESKACNRSCGIGASNGFCMWREATLPRSSKQWNEPEPTPSTTDLIREYATCRSDSTSCPDSWCDPLELLNDAICPQDCIRGKVTGQARINSDTNRGIYSASFQSVCTCSTPTMCQCLPHFSFDQKPQKTTTTTEKNQEDKLDDMHNEIRENRTSVQQQTEFEPYSKNDQVYCDRKCKTGIIVSTCLVISLISALILLRKRNCFGVGKLKSDGTEDGNMSIDPLVPLQTLNTNSTTLTPTQTPQEQIEIDTKWEIPRSRVEILETLGEGEFGKVLKAEVKDLPSKQGLTTVAVKTLKDNAGTLELNDLTSEYNLLKEVNHPNIIKLLGACTTPDGPIYIIIEYCSLGSLKNYLRKSRNAKAHECLEAGSRIEVTPKDILSFSWQICKGMAYLAEMKMVHRDLATRNILLAENKKCKISDFGMTRDVYVDDTYLKVSRSRVPVKWMAIESLKEQVYTSKSDVWSLGIVLWELVTLGASPYPGIPAEKLYGLLTSGYRMPRPANCSIRLYEIMRDCWATEPFRRPTFAQLRSKFESMLGEDIEYLNCNIHAFSNPAYFNNNKPSSSMNNLDIKFSMSLDDLQSTNLTGGFNLYENDIQTSIVSYDVPKPVKSPNTYVTNKKLKDKIIDEKVDNR